MRGRDLTSGNLQRAIWALAPAMMLETGILNVSQLLDTYWVSRLGSAALAAVTISMTVRWVLNSLSNGLGIGGMAVVARRTGEQDQAAAEHATSQVILLALMVSLTMGGLGLFLARPLLDLLGADADVLPLGVAYLQVAFGGLFTMVLVFVINAMLRGAGEAKLAMNVLFVATATTIVLQPVLISGLGPLPGLGVAGSAWAFVLGYGAGLGLQLVILLRGKARIGLTLHDLRPDFPLMGRVIRIALPSTVQMTLRSSSRLAIMWLVGLYGTYAIAGYGVANRLVLIALIPSFGLGNAAGTLVGQNLGAHKPGRAERSAWWVSAYSGAYIAVVAAIIFAFAPAIIRFFDPTPEVVAIGAQCARIIAPSLVASAIGVVLARGFDGAGNTIPAMTINLLSLWVLEIPLAFGLARVAGLGLLGIWLGRALANVANGLFFAAWFKRGKWKEREV
jgi:putative MATE family efflux protein